MNKITFTAATIGVALLGGTAWFYTQVDGKEVVAYRTAPITRATLKSTISATGALSAVRTVQVGTQVSGQVAKIYVDFNDKVKKGQLLARIDPTLQEQAVQDAQAQLERVRAQLTLAQDEYARSSKLLAARVITPSEFATTQSNFSVQQATVKSAQIALDRAKQNLSYTSIYAPIDGVIVERNVDVGQTVAASLSAPQLFLIANDLSEMQILASVDESDIGVIKDGASAQFTVQSYPNQQFQGTVRQVRLQSTTTDNVVSYTAVVSVSNAAGKLLPGMTATVQFVTGVAENVLTVPNAALRIKPTAEMIVQAGQGTTAATSGATRPDSSRVAAPRADSARAGRGGGRGGAGGRAGGAGGNGTATSLWYVDAKGALHTTRVRTGQTDGQRTQVSGPGLAEGLQVVTTIGGATNATPTTTSTNPLQPTRPPVGGGRRGF
jgi:HlyD family secretion protein